MTAPTTPRGFVDDLAFFGGTFGTLLSDFAEDVPDLLWPESVQTYARMRRDPQLTAMLGALTLPIRGATWHVDPMGARPEVAALVAEDLGLTVAGADRAPSGARVRGVMWEDHLRLALLALLYGHMPFEELYEIRGGQARLIALSERLPQTIAEIDVDTQGRLVGATQFVPTGRVPQLAASRLLWYANDREGAAWQGRSMFRPCYAPWLLKREMQRVHATSQRRQGMGVPVVEAQPGTTPSPAQMVEAQRAASSARVGDSAGMATPPGFRLRLAGVDGGIPDTLGFLRYLNQEMSRSALAGFLDLGETPNGSRALGESFVDLFLLTLQSKAKWIAATITAQTVARMVEYNWGPDEPVPAVCVGDVGSRREVTAESLQTLLTSGALSADPALETWVRTHWGLPERETPPTPPPPPAPTPPAPPAPPAQATRRRTARRKPAAAATGVMRRQPTLVEAAAGTDFEAVQAQWGDALDQLVDDWDSITEAQRAEILDQIRAAVDDDEIDRLAELAVDSADAAELLAARMQALAGDAADQMRDEAKSQGVTPPKSTPDGERLGALASTIAALAANGLAQAAAKKAIQAWTSTATADEVTSAVSEHLESLTDAGLRDYLGSGLSAAQNEGRLSVLRAAPDADYYASEVLDRNTCGPCQAIDGHQFNTLVAAEDSYANGGYARCAGGLRCRGIVVAVWGGGGS